MVKSDSSKLEELELKAVKLRKEDMILFDQTDKPFLTLYLFIFIFGIALTIVGV
jgi:hypothetical protein